MKKLSNPFAKVGDGFVSDNGWRDFMELSAWIAIFTAIYNALESGELKTANARSFMMGLCLNPSNVINKGITAIATPGAMRQSEIALAPLTPHMDVALTSVTEDKSGTKTYTYVQKK